MKLLWLGLGATRKRVAPFCSPFRILVLIIIIVIFLLILLGSRLTFLPRRLAAPKLPSEGGSQTKAGHVSRNTEHEIRPPPLRPTRKDKAFPHKITWIRLTPLGTSVKVSQHDFVLFARRLCHICNVRLPERIMHSNPTSVRPKSPCRTAWAIFWTGIGLIPLAFAIWIGMTGVSPWFSPRQEQGHAIVRVLVRSAYVVCMVAPFFARTSFLRKLGYSVLAGFGVVVTYYTCALLNLLLIGV